MDLKKLSDKEIALRMINYITRAIELENKISTYMHSKITTQDEADDIKNLYKELKKDVQADAKYMNICDNKKGSDMYTHFFVPSIKEASVYGFAVLVNGQINLKMYDAVDEAHTRFTDYYSLDDWKRIAEK